MKNTNSRTGSKFLLTFFLLLIVNTLFSQVSIYEKIEKTGKNSFNYANDKSKAIKLKKDKSIAVVYSDRANNTTYTDPFLQLKGLSQDFLTPYFVIGSNNDAYEVVVADSTLIGKPKSLFSVLMNRKYHFTNAEQVKYIGWIPKGYVLKYKESFVSETNNKPLKYKIGIDNTEGLYELNKAFKGDSIRVFKDPFLKNRSTKKLALNQTVYPFKYNSTRKAVLISNKPTITDTIANAIGWVPANLISPIGQGALYDLAQQDSVLTLRECDNLQLQRGEIHSGYLYKDAPNTLYSANSGTNIPIYVWNHKQNKLTNVKGNNILIADANRLKSESKTVNFHFIFNENEKSLIKPLINSLQNLGIFFTDHKDLEYSFSAVCIAREGSYILPKTESFAKWLNFIQNIVEGGPKEEKLLVKDILDLSQALSTSIDKNLETDKKFENNLFIIANNHNDHYLHRQEDLMKELALRSSKLLFVQLQNQTKDSYQNNLLLAKEALSKTEAYYNGFIENYIIENDLLIDQGSLKNVESEISNIYIYDAPGKSLFNGGIIFPSINKAIDAQALSVAMDTLLVNSIRTNKKLISSLHKYEVELGTVRSEPSRFLKCIFKADTLKLDSIDRSNPNDVYYKTIQLDQKTINAFDKGYEMSREELVALIENYRALLPRFSKSKLPKLLKNKMPLDSSEDLEELTSNKQVAKKGILLTKKNRRALQVIYKKQIRGINKAFKRKVIQNYDRLSILFFYKTGIKVNNDFNKFQSFKIKSDQTMENGFYEFYNRIINKVDVLEKKFLDDELQKIDNNVYFVPQKLLL